MRRVAFFLSLIVAVVGIGWSVDQLRIDKAKRSLERSTIAAFNADQTAQRRLASRHIRILGAYLQRHPFDFDLHVEIAANYRLIDRLDDATRHYEAALRLERRPEIYANLAAVRAAAGDYDGTVRALARAARFWRTWYKFVPGFGPQVLKYLADHPTDEQTDDQFLENSD